MLTKKALKALPSAGLFFTLPLLFYISPKVL